MVEPHSLLSLRKDVAVERIQRLGLRRASQAHNVSSKASLRRAEEYSGLEMSRVRLHEPEGVDVQVSATRPEKAHEWNLQGCAMVEPHSLLSLRKDVAVERIQRLGLRRASQAHNVSSKASLRRAEEYSGLEMSRVRLHEAEGVEVQE